MANKKSSKKTSKPEKKLNTEVKKADSKDNVIDEKPIEEETASKEVAVEETSDELETAEVIADEKAEKKSSKDKASKDKNSKSDKKSDKKKHSIKQFFKDIKSEIKKIVWASKHEVFRSTCVVLLVVFCIGIVIWLSDWGLTGLRSLLYKLG